MRDQVVYYDDPLGDDFAGNHISTREVGAEFDYVPSGILYNALGTLLYYLVAIPVVWLLTKICLGLRMKNRKALRAVRGKAFYLYGNHTQNLDAVIPALAAFPQRAYVIAHRDAVSIPGLRTIVQMLGAIPVPSSLSGMGAFAEALERRAEQGACIGIYPEAHVWPYYTGVRPFKAASFRYPARTSRPVVAMAATYRPPAAAVLGAAACHDRDLQRTHVSGSRPAAPPCPGGPAAASLRISGPGDRKARQHGLYPIHSPAGTALTHLRRHRRRRFFCKKSGIHLVNPG